MRRVVNALVALGLFVAGTVAFSAPASAAPCYPLNAIVCHQAEIFSSTNAPFQGQTIEASGLHYLGTEAVRLTIGGIFVGTTHTDAKGAFDPPVKVPSTLLGDQVLTGTGASGTSNDIASLTLHIRAPGASVAATAATAAAASTATGGTAFTGVRIAEIVAVAALLLAGGVALTMSGRRRKAAAH